MKTPAATRDPLEKRMLEYLTAKTGPSKEMRQSIITRACWECYGEERSQWPSSIAVLLS
jgi:hypothetical protein